MRSFRNFLGLLAVSFVISGQQGEAQSTLFKFLGTDAVMTPN
ncbi:MAG TPA: hypothetical protein VK210_17295 [Terriglobia bacterium]|nr:hypothetical protein [Terriglobia bacterium]